MRHNTRVFAWLALALLVVASAACQVRPVSKDPGADLAQVLKTVETASGGWKPSEEAKLFTKDTLFDLMNGQSDAFFVYGFQKAAVQRFTGAGGSTLIASVFQVDAPDSAYGLFSVNRDPQPLKMGNEGSGSPGQRLSFWQARYFVQLTALKTVADADLQSAGQAIAAALPTGGEIPALVSGLPKADQLADTPPVFFHQELSIQDRVWLGGENKLGLGPETDGVLGAYSLGQQVVTLMVIEYPQPGQAAEGLKGLEAVGLSDLQAARVKGRRLALVTGAADPGAAQKLVDAALP